MFAAHNKLVFKTKSAGWTPISGFTFNRVFDDELDSYICNQ